MVEVVHRSCCSRAASRRPPLILAIFSIRIGHSEAFFIVGMKSIVRIVVLQLIVIQIVILLVVVLIIVIS
jgi:hypothetical protein